MQRYFGLRFFYVFILVLNFLLGFAQSSSPIEILRTDRLVYDASVGRFQRCIGNVMFKQDEIFMNCDSAWFYEDVNIVKAYGNVYIRQQDSFDLWGRFAVYDGNAKHIKITDNVKLTDGKMVLNTDKLEYEINPKIAYYNTYGRIENQKDTLRSKFGSYHSRTKVFFFKNEVLLTNPEYSMESDTLDYHTKTQLAYFFGPTVIKSEENTINCNNGWYNTRSNQSQFSNGVTITGAENELFADSMLYDRNTGFGEAYKNIILTDTIEQVTIVGDTGYYQRFTQTTEIIGNPLATKMIDEDTMFLKADYLKDYRDTLGKRLLMAHKNVLLYKSDIQAVADSLSYAFNDSTMSLFQDPILWSDQNQITGDTIVIHRNFEGIQFLDAYFNGMIIEEDENGFYNQISGKFVKGLFRNNRLNEVDVNGNGRSIYYAKEDDPKQYTGVNDIVCGSMLIRLDTAQKVDNIVFYQKPEATFYPVEKFPEDKSRVPGFSWQLDIRPIRSYFYRQVIAQDNEGED